jgi:hypothetical protein
MSLRALREFTKDGWASKDHIGYGDPVLWAMAPAERPPHRRVVRATRPQSRKRRPKLSSCAATDIDQEPYTLRSSPSAHFTASSADMPWTALAYMSTMMYLARTSAALDPAGPA